MSSPLVLASTSRYRAELLRRLTSNFIQVRPEVEESALPGESPVAMCLRLAEAKARAAASGYPASCLIGSDQVAEFEGLILGKPGNHAEAVRQLNRFSGKTVLFHSGLCVFNAGNGHCHTAVNTTRVEFRHLDAMMIESYLQREQPYDCAGSFKSEGLGIALFTRIQSDDPSSLIGLPLITLVGFLAEEGVCLL